MLPVTAHEHGIEEFVVNGETVDPTYLQGATVPPKHLIGLLDQLDNPAAPLERFNTMKSGLLQQRLNRCRAFEARIDNSIERYQMIRECFARISRPVQGVDIAPKRDADLIVHAVTCDCLAGLMAVERHRVMLRNQIW